MTVYRNFDIVKEGDGKGFVAVDKYFILEITPNDDVFVDDELCPHAWDT